MIKTYISIYPDEFKNGRFLKLIRKGAVVNINMGLNSIQNSPKSLAKFLGKNDFQKYTSHCMRRSGASILAENNISVNLLKDAGDWKTDKVCQNYIDGSVSIKRKISDFFSDKKEEKKPNIVEEKKEIEKKPNIVEEKKDVHLSNKFMFMMKNPIFKKLEKNNSQNNLIYENKKKEDSQISPKTKVFIVPGINGNTFDSRNRDIKRDFNSIFFI